MAECLSPVSDDDGSARQGNLGTKLGSSKTIAGSDYYGAVTRVGAARAVNGNKRGGEASFPGRLLAQSPRLARLGRIGRCADGAKRLRHARLW